MQKAVKQPGGAGDPRAINRMNRDLVVAYAQNMFQPIFSNTLSGTLAGQVVTVPFRPAGLIKRFLIKISGNITQGAAETQNLTKFGPANVLSNITLTDLSNEVRINTTGWHLHFLASARRQAVHGAAYTSDSPAQMGNVMNPIKAPAAVTTVQPWQMYYEVPVTYGDQDLRGVINANVPSAQGQLQFTINPNFSVASTASEASAVYKSTTAQIGVLSAISVTVYQNYLDQLPVDPRTNRVIMPALDMGISYDLKSTVVTGLSLNNDTPISYSNWRDFMSTFAVYDNQGLNAGTDIAAWRIRAANSAAILDVDPTTAALIGARWNMSDDFPAGVYYFDHRAKPISTQQFGNMQLNINPSSVAGVATQVLVGWEALAYLDQMQQAGSLYAN